MRSEFQKPLAKRFQILCRIRTSGREVAREMAAWVEEKNVPAELGGACEEHGAQCLGEFCESRLLARTPEMI